jgi:hypothetical protein
MFKTLYRCARTAARHDNGPAARSRLAYLNNKFGQLSQGDTPVTGGNVVERREPFVASETHQPTHWTHEVRRPLLLL